VIDSADVNAYLREISGHDYSAKDFRTWAEPCWRRRRGRSRDVCVTGSGQAQRDSRDRISRQAARQHPLGMPQVLHPPAILDAYMDGATIATLRGRAARVAKGGGLSAEESAVVAMIELGLAARARPRAAARATSSARDQRHTAGAKARRAQAAHSSPRPARRPLRSRAW
jgi:DNA topoisomerase I